MKLVLIIAFILSSYCGFAQKDPIEFGNVSMEELNMTSYIPDTSATAVILMDYGKTYINSTVGSFVLIRERTLRIKILSKDGLGWANFRIPYVNKSQKITEVKGITFNLENGLVEQTKLTSEGIVSEQVNKYLDVQSFTLPKVKVGSVLEVTYTISSENYKDFPDWQFQYSIPTKHSEYRVTIPDIFIFEKYLAGYITVTDYTVKDVTRSDLKSKQHRWVLSNVPAFKPEPFMSSERDYLSKIFFALSYIDFPGYPIEVMGSWSKLQSNLYKNEGFGGILSKGNGIKDITKNLIAGLTTPEDKIKAIYKYVTSTLEWNGIRDFIADPPKTVLEKKKGTTADINVMLGAMLIQAGIPIKIVLLSTRDHGFVREQYPTSSQFNYVVCMTTLGDRTLFLDGTERNLPLGVLPERCLNGQGLVISESEPLTWIPLNTKQLSKNIVYVDLALDKDATLKGTLSYTRDGYAAYRMRNTLLQSSKEIYLKEFSDGESFQILKSEFQNIEDLSLLPIEKHEIVFSDQATLNGDLIYLNPILFNKIESNPFISETRTYPIDFNSPIESTFVGKIQLPEGFIIEEIPPAKLISLPQGSGKFRYSISNNGNTINIVSSLIINKNLFLQDEYQFIKEFYNQIVLKHAEQIVIKKKS